MPGFRRIMQALAAITLLLSLGLAPVTDALTHGLGTLLAEAEHAAFHAERGEHWTATGHQHHDASDHDHATPAILEAGDETLLDFATAIETGVLPQMTGVIRDGPRRPPRGPALTA